MVSHVPLSGGPSGMVGIFRCDHVPLKEENKSDNAVDCAAMDDGAEYLALNCAMSSEQSTPLACSNSWTRKMT